MLQATRTLGCAALQHLFAALLLLNLSSCALFSATIKAPTELDCTNANTTCNAGRFAVVWQSDEGGTPVREAVSGRYNWRSVDNSRLAELQLTSALGPTLAKITTKNENYELKLGDQRVFEGNSWQSLFNMIFPFTIPAGAIIDWLNNPSVKIVNLPEGWTGIDSNGKYRLNYKNQTNNGRIDLIPDAAPNAISPHTAP